MKYGVLDFMAKGNSRRKSHPLPTILGVLVLLSMKLYELFIWIANMFTIIEYSLQFRYLRAELKLRLASGLSLLVTAKLQFLAAG